MWELTEGFCGCGEEEWRETGTEHGRIGCAAEVVDAGGLGGGGMMDGRMISLKGIGDGVSDPSNGNGWWNFISNWTGPVCAERMYGFRDNISYSPTHVSLNNFSMRTELFL